MLGERNRLLPSADEHHVSTRVETFVGFVLVLLVLPSTRRSGERKPIEIAGSKFQMQTVRFSPDSLVDRTAGVTGLSVLAQRLAVTSLIPAFNNFIAFLGPPVGCGSRSYPRASCPQH